LKLALVRLTVSDSVREHLTTTSERSVARGAELGGALLGAFHGPDELVINSAIAAGDDGGFTSGFQFQPGFWVSLGKTGGRPNMRIVGWYHSHLCDQGHPSVLSDVDLRIMHQHFAAPWLVTALVCASRRDPLVRWYDWKDGSVVERTGSALALRNQQQPDGGKR
jgi:proteasome lid subunit RPN8/RPN11